MERDESYNLIEERLVEHPEMRELISDPEFKNTLGIILQYLEVGTSNIDAIEFEILIVLIFYAPLSDLAQNITETTTIPLETTERMVTMIESMLLSTVTETLEEFEIAWKQQLEKEASLPQAPADTREKLELRPEGVIPAAQNAPTSPATGALTPLTREEVMRALSSKRTMSGDIESIKQEGRDA